MNGPQQGKRFLLKSGTSTIGRGRENEVVLRDGEASRAHAEIRIDEGSISLVDLDSSNGTYQNNKRIKTSELSVGGQFSIGKTVLLLLAEREPKSTDSADLSAGQTQTSLPEDSSEFSFDDPMSTSHTFAIDGLQTVHNNLQFLYDAAVTTSRTGESKEMCLKLLSLVFDWIAADRGCILLRDEADGQLRPGAIKYRSNIARRNKLEVSQSIVNYVTEKVTGILTHDAAQDTRWTDGKIVVEGIKEVICVPIQGQSRLFGVIYVDRIAVSDDASPDRESFNPDQLKLIIAIAHQAAVAFESENYYSEIVKSERHTAIGQTLASLSHHVKNILQSINGGAHLVEKGIGKKDLKAIQSGWKIISGNQKRISNMMLDMLNFSQPSKPLRKWCAIDDLIATAIREQQELAQRQGVTLVANAMSDHRLVMLDPVTMDTAIGNIIVHAVPIITPIEDGTMVVTAKIEKNNLVIEFEDNFQIATDEELEQIFLPFGMESDVKVRGISLAVSHKIVSEHEGTLTVKRNKNGLTFTITLPQVGQ